MFPQKTEFWKREKTHLNLPPKMKLREGKNNFSVFFFRKNIQKIYITDISALFSQSHPQSIPHEKPNLLPISAPNPRNLRLYAATTTKLKTDDDSHLHGRFHQNQVFNSTHLLNFSCLLFPSYLLNF